MESWKNGQIEIKTCHHSHLSPEWFIIAKALDKKVLISGNEVQNKYHSLENNSNNCTCHMQRMEPCCIHKQITNYVPRRTRLFGLCIEFSVFSMRTEQI